MVIEIPADWPSQDAWVRDTPIGHLETVTLGPPQTVIRTNLFTNPSGETNATGWESNSGFGAYDIATIARSTLRAWVGAASILVTAPPPVIGETWGNCTNTPVVIGGTYNYSAYVWSPIDAVFFADALFQAQGPDTFVPAATWTRVSVTFKANSVNAFVGVGIAGAPSGFQYHIDGALLEKSGSRNSYFDGSTPDVTTPGAEVEYAWKGAAHASASTATMTVQPQSRRWDVASWETTREIASSALPGQVRARTGLSVGTGKALVKRDSDDYPWKKREIYDLPGSDAQILIAPENCTEIPTGQFKVAPINGNITTLGVDVDLDEKTIEGRDKKANVQGWGYLEAAGQPDGVLEVDPSWWIEQLAQQLGYGVGLRPGQGGNGGAGYKPILDAPLQGSHRPVFPAGFPYNGIGSWAKMPDAGVIALEQPTSGTSAEVKYYLGRTSIPSTIITLDVYNTARVLWDCEDATTNGSIWVEVVNYRVEGTGSPLRERIDVTVQSRGANGTLNSGTTQSFQFVQDADRPQGIQLQFEPISSDGINWTGARARVARTATAAWSSWVTHAAANSPGLITHDTRVWDVWVSARPNPIGGDGDQLSKIARVSIVDLIVTGNAPNRPVDLWNNDQGEQGRIYLEPLFGSISSPWLSPELSTWGAMQAIVEAWQGALITDVYGALRLLNRFSLTGVGTGAELPIDVGLKFEDLPWSMDASDQADRLVFRYRPARVVASDPAATKLPIIWEASEVIPTWPGGNDIFFNTDYLYLMYSAELPWVQKGSPDYNEVYHTWDAYRYSNGTGAHMQPNSDVGIRIEQITVSTWKVYVENRTASPFHLVDNTGTPWLKVRSLYHMDQTRETFIERGLPATEAKNPIEIDVSNYVQNEEDANALADFIWARSSQRAWRADTITMASDYRLDLGDVVEVTHARTGMRSNALVTKVHLTGQPGEVRHQIDLVLIPVTWEDFDEAWYDFDEEYTWNDFDALWAPYTWDDFDRAPAAITTAEIEEAL